MQRLLLFVIFLYVVWRILYVVGQKLAGKSPGADAFSRFSGKSRERRAGREEAPERLVTCSRCGTSVPASRAVQGPGGPYCSRSCLEAGDGE